VKKLKAKLEQNSLLIATSAEAKGKITNNLYSPQQRSPILSAKP
jgi:hypothetical protein